MRNTEKDEIQIAENREAMLSEGFRLFSEKGIEAVSMQEVARACRLGIATLYRYYSTKLDFVIAVGTQKWMELREVVGQMHEERHPENMTAAERLDFYLAFYIYLYREHKDLLRFNQDFNNYVQQKGASPEQLRGYLDAINIFNLLVRDIYDKGMQDGTIRTDYPVEKLFAGTSHIMMAVAVRYANGLLFRADDEEERLDELELLRRMILREYQTAGDAVKDTADALICECY